MIPLKTIILLTQIKFTHDWTFKIIWQVYTSTSFTDGGSGGGIYHGYNPGNEYEDICKIENGTYPNPMIVSHGVADNVVPQ